MGMATILHARRIVLIATGKSKARCIETRGARADHDEAAGVVPAAAPDVELMLDEARGASTVSADLQVGRVRSRQACG